MFQRKKAHVFIYIMVKHCPITNCSCGLENRGCCTYDSGKFILNVENQQKFLPKPLFWQGDSYIKTEKYQTPKFSDRFGKKVSMFKIFLLPETFGHPKF